MKEIEILVELYTDIKTCKNILSKYDYVGEKLTIDDYYYDPLRDNLKPDSNLQINECLRLRTKKDKHYITYKVDNFDNNKKWLYSDEYETEISDIKQLEKIISLLGLKKLLTINNKKTIYKSDKYEIALEEVENLGNFLEVEYCTEEDVDIRKIKQDIQSFIDNLELKVSEELNMGKPEMILKRNKIDN